MNIEDVMDREIHSAEMQVCSLSCCYRYQDFAERCSCTLEAALLKRVMLHAYQHE
jgi:hypothetical protein